MKKVFSLLSCLLCLGFTSCDKGEDDPKPVVPPSEKKVEIVINFAVPDDFDHEGGIMVKAVALFTNDLIKEIAVLSYSFPTTKQTLVGEPFSNYLGEPMYLFVRVRRTLEGYPPTDEYNSWVDDIYVAIPQLQEKTEVFVQFPSEHRRMIIGKP